MLCGKSENTTILPLIHWFSTTPPEISPKISDWLHESGSMTHRFEQHCQQVTVTPQQQQFIPPQELDDDERCLLPTSARYWLREIVLNGDDNPWLIGRTIIPEETLSGPEQALCYLGQQPLGRYLFSNKTLARDRLQFGRQGENWARRSLLYLSGKPLLLIELFLPDAPLYWPIK